MRTTCSWMGVGIGLLAAWAWAGPLCAEPVTPPAFRRSVEQTFLTYPEWFLVYSPAEYADYVREHSPTRFPFLGHIGQFWGSYWHIYQATRRDYPFNGGYHLMIVVIGTSTTIEYAAKAAYQTLVGRWSDGTRTHGPTEEDLFDARVAQDYVDFIRLYPWYEYDFTGQLVRLWKETHWWGPDPFRKWERKYALTSEYGIKAIYGWLIKQADRTVYAEEPLTTVAVLDRPPSGIEGTLHKLKIDQRLPDGGVEVTVPRYDAFKDYATILASQGVHFREIAGNSSIILVTLLTRTEESLADDPRSLLFTQPILTRPPWRREAIVVPVASLSAFLETAKREGAVLEHIYDY